MFFPWRRVGKPCDAFLLLDENLTVSPYSLRGRPIEELGCIGLKLLSSDSLNLRVHHGGNDLFSEIALEVFMLTFIVAFEAVVSDDIKVSA